MNISLGSPEEIPLPTDTPLFDQRVKLSGRDFVLRLDYNESSDLWYADLYQEDGVTPIVRGMLVEPSQAINALVYSRADAPDGVLMWVASEQEQCRFADLGRRVSLVYMPVVRTPDTVTEPVIGV